MKQAICLQCHTNPDMVNYLIECIPREHFDFYIHVDKKSDVFKKIVRKENVFFSERINVRWGTFSQVEATLMLFKMIDTKKYSYIHLISGNDFIVKTPSQIIDFFSNNDKEYIESNPLPGNCTWSWNGEDRYTCYYPQWLIRRPADKMFRILRVSYREFIMRTKLFKRKHFPVTNFYGGSSWFSITGGSIKWMMQYLLEHPDYVNHFRNGVCVDEVFFSTLIRYSPYENKIANQHLRFMKWEGSTIGGPKTLTNEDFDDLIQSEAIWARKFHDLKTTKALYEKLNNT